MSTFKSEHNINKKYMTCPYDPSHKVPHNRYAIHVTKCQTRSTEVLLICPFNACHRLLRHEYEEHIINCKDQLNIVNVGSDVVQPAVDNKPDQPITAEDTKTEIKKEEENWD